jgi:hypothetical protein
VAASSGRCERIDLAKIKLDAKCIPTPRRLLIGNPGETFFSAEIAPHLFGISSHLAVHETLDLIAVEAQERGDRKMSGKKRQDFIEEIRAKQRNTLWPEMQANSRAVDSLIFLGDRNATPVQRIGIGLFGAFFVLAGIAFIGIGRDLHSFAPLLISFAAFLLGGLVLFNSARGLGSKKTKG